MKTSTLLRKAKRHLWDGKSKRKSQVIRGLCVAIMCAETDATYGLGFAVRERIGRSLGRHLYVETWLKYRVKVPRCLRTAENMQEYRHRWLDALIAEYEARGD